MAQRVANYTRMYGVAVGMTQLRDIKVGLFILMLMNLAFFAVHVIAGVGCR